MLAIFAAVALLQASGPTAAQEASAKLWADMAALDVATYCHDIREFHSGMIDPFAPGFAPRVEEACKKAQVAARAAGSYDDWYRTMADLVGGFRDRHTWLAYELPMRTSLWPGFLITGQGGEYVVKRPDLPNLADPGQPPEGARFLGCDDKSADDFLRNTLDPGRADWTREAERIRLAYRGFVAIGIDPTPTAERCRFESNGVISDVQLNWRSVNHQKLGEATGSFRRVRPRRYDLDYAEDHSFEVEFADDGHAWIRIGDVSQEGKLEELASDLEAKQAQLRVAPYVVFDLRGNSGGNSMWGNRFASILWGEEAVEGSRLAAQSDDPAESGKYWRASSRVAEEFHKVADGFRARGPDMVEVAGFFDRLADTLAAQPENTLYRDECCRREPIPENIPDPEYDGRVFVVTDANVFSSGILVVNTLKRMGAIQVGEVTGRNEMWGESVGPIHLPSGLGYYRIPVSIIRQSKESLGGLPVDIAWNGAMDDDAGLRSWIAELARRPEGTLPGK